MTPPKLLPKYACCCILASFFQLSADTAYFFQFLQFFGVFSMKLSVTKDSVQ